MTTTHAVLLVLIALSIAVGMWVRVKWARVVLATVFLCIQIFVLVLGIDISVRLALVDDIKARGHAPDGARAVALVKNAQLPDRLTVVLAGVGLFVLAVLRPRASRAKTDSPQQRQSTAQDGAATS